MLKSGEVAPERMKRLSQSGHCPVVDVSGGERKSDAVKNSIA